MNVRRIILSLLLIYQLPLVVVCQSHLATSSSWIIGELNVECPIPGTIQYNHETNDFEGWNGFYWVSLTGYQYYTDEVIDVDGHVYKTVEINGKMWMAENLRTTRYQDSTLIPEVVSDTTWENANYGAWCKLSNNNSLEEIYGKLYNWFTIQDARGVCPIGWHVPTMQEWDDMRRATHPLGHRDITQDLWRFKLGDNNTGFTALPGGHRGPTGYFSGREDQANFWSSTEDNIDDAVYYRIEYYSNTFEERDWSKNMGHSIRCIRVINN